MDRRQFLATGMVGIAMARTAAQTGIDRPLSAHTGRLRQSVARWCFADIPLESFCRQLQAMGVTGMDLAGPDEWDICRHYAITPCMILGAGTFLPAKPGSPRMFGPSVGWNKRDNHARLVESARTSIELGVQAGVHGIVGLFGDREGMSDEQGIENCVTGLRQIVPILEENDFTLAFELLNSKVDHPDYQGDNTAFGVAVCREVGSDKVKLLYDAYHMQIMEGNLISTIRENIEYIYHIHVAGVPGRHELDENQEVNWHAVANAIADLNFSGYVAHEWIPTGVDPMTDLRTAVKIMTV